MVCPEVKVYLAFQVATTVFQYLFLGSHLFWGAAKLSSALAILGFAGLLWLLCNEGMRKFSWWFVAITIPLGIMFNLAMVLDPEVKTLVARHAT